MNFRPAIQSALRGIHVTQPLQFRAWQGVIADLWQAAGEAGGGGDYVAPYPRIVLFLGAGAQDIELTSAGQGAQGVAALYVPSDTPVSSRILRRSAFAHVDLHLEPSALANRLASLPQRPGMSAPRFLPPAPRLQHLTAMMADEIAAPERASMMLEGLLLAMLAEVFETRPEETSPALQASDSAQRGGLTPRQLAIVGQRVDAHPDRRLSVAEMAEAAGLSESWFAHAFKRSTGQSPQRWQMRRRIDVAAAMMQNDPGMSLAEIAAATGFVDQAHLTRAFRTEMGKPPALWRRESVTGHAPETLILPRPAGRGPAFAAE